jgi:hypothetical protein
MDNRALGKYLRKYFGMQIILVLIGKKDIFAFLFFSPVQVSEKLTAKQA